MTAKRPTQACATCAGKGTVPTFGYVQPFSNPRFYCRGQACLDGRCSPGFCEIRAELWDTSDTAQATTIPPYESSTLVPLDQDHSDG